MRVPFFIARRYFLFGRKINFINIVSLLSILVVAFVTMSLVVALSVFNGLENLIRSLYNTFDPQLKISAVKGKSFTVDHDFLEKLKSNEGIAIITEVIEDNVLVKYKEDQMVVKMKGVSESFLKQKRLDSMIVAGQLKFHENGKDYAIIGRGIQYNLAISLNSEINPLQVWYPKNIKAVASLSPDKVFSRENIRAGAVFAIEKQYDDNYIFVPLDFAQRLLNYGDKRTSLEIKVKDGFKINKVRDQLRELLGEDFLVQNSDEQHASLLRAVKIEKLFMFFTISFILAVASMNIFFCLTMLAINKKRDVAILYSLGATPNMVRAIFLTEGAMIAFTGAILGLVLGIGLCLAQQHYGMVSMGMETSLVDAYPVKMELTDFISTGITIIVITFLASVRPATRAIQVSIRENI
ncbi:MAG: FtsX-like permease family protein [Sporocytophaga sp.]|uniref:ABC transporter permease n=1 Tax=Sporocytophaga sp. TaxID=2231183 RepID=UPI001B1B18F6|nr:FtsX-like permease family protein [Sporocytophaga sp.]MBO9702021.1 FtsX-like permease family protein [Sporocytophaga sp.]